MLGGEEEFIQHFGRNSEGKRPLARLIAYVRERVILKWTLQKQDEVA
jgi:hypothetical protein